jgi:hypothetical protein
LRPFPVSFRHLERMTDDTGLLEHCLGNIPRRQEGYTTDDNARALWACAEWLSHADEAENRNIKETLDRLIDRYLSFLLWVQREDGTFHNNIGYARIPEREEPSDDCLGRALWACAVASVKLPDPERRFVASELFTRGLPRAWELTYPRGWAFALAACSYLIMNGGDRSLTDFIRRLEEKFIRLYRQSRSEDWHWFESVMAYGNGVLPWSLFLAYRVTKREETLAVAKESLDFLIDKMTGSTGVIRPIGNNGWCTRQRRSDWDQQPLDVMKLALASAEAYATLKCNRYRRTLDKCRAWFYGENDLGVPMANADEGSCYDGLTPNGVNLNQGAESTLSYLLTEAIYRHVEMEVDANVRYSCTH